VNPLRIDTCHDLNPLAQSPAAATTPAAAGRTPPLVPTVTPHGDAARGEGDLRQFIIAIPPRTVLLNANDRPNRYARARIVKNLRTIACQLAVIGRIPHLDRVEITGFVHPPDNRDRDPHNWYPTLKATIDGTVDAGVISKDTSAFLIRADMQLGEETRYLSFSLLIREAK
jgi:hypothetical protein